MGAAAGIQEAETSSVELAVGGMTCASCAARVEKKLNKLDGVTASVNYATERASVTFPVTVTPEDLIEVVTKTGYTAELPAPAGTVTDSLPRRLGISLAFAVPVLVLAMLPATMHDPVAQWLALALATPVATWGAWPFHRAAAINARHQAATMDTLVSVGVIAAYGWSVYALVSASADTYLDTAAGVTVLVLLGRYLESRARHRSGQALRALASLGAKEAVRLHPRTGAEERVPADQLRPGDLFVVRPGEKIAADGVVTGGTSAIDTSILTGEPVPADVAVKDEVTGGCLNTYGRLTVRATKVGKDTQLAQIARIVEAAQSGKAKVQRLADRVSAVFVPVVIALALITLVAWLLTGHPVVAAFTAAVAVLIIACPCAMGLATPTALLTGTGRGAQLGILIKGPEILESTRAVDTILLDKTGTVTTGLMSLAGVEAADGEDPDEALRLAAAVESASEHPVAQAIASAARGSLSSAASAALPAVAGFKNHQGLGVAGVVDGREVRVGRANFSAERFALIPPSLTHFATAAEAKGQTVTYISWDGEVRGALAVSDTIKPTSAEAVARLRRLGLRPVLLTGDNERAARAVASEVGIEEVIAGVLPAGKAAVVKELQAEGRVVAVAGDGVNDAAALAQADLGLAMGTGTHVAMEASDLTLVRGDLRAAADAIALSRRTLGTIKGNLLWAFGYNVAAIPLAALGLLNPLVAAAAMAFSSVFVVTNSLRLRRFRPARYRLRPAR